MPFNLVIVLFFLLADFAFAEDPINLRFGVLSFRPKEVTMAQWSPFVQELQKKLHGHPVELLPMPYPELDQAAKEKQIDFILTNPEHYILLKNQLAVNAVATMITLEKGHPMTEFAGVIFTRADRTDIQTITDLNGKTIAAPAEGSLGGYLMQRWEMEKNNVTAGRYDFTGMPHDKVIDEVLSGKADAGFVRSGILETLARAGKITLEENPSVRVLKALPTTEDLPLLHSTEHYPEWPFAVGSHISPELARKVSLILLSIKSDSEVAKAAGIAGFNPPADYTPVEVLMLRLRSHPNELKYFNIRDVLLRYREFFIAMIAAGLLIMALVVSLTRTNKQFKNVANENRKLLLAVEQSPVSIVITDLDANIQYANQTFFNVTGYQYEEVIGQNPRVLKSTHNNQHIYDEMWAALTSGKEWRGELINCRKDGSEYIEATFITPVREVDGSIQHYLAIKQDITERKQAEDQIKQLAFYDPLTNLPNRRKLLDRLNYTIALSHREGKRFAVCLMDLDKFKPVNDTLGHAAGDDLLQQVAIRISQHLRHSDMVARLGGDEFVIVLENVNSSDDAAHVALKIIADLTVPFELTQGDKVQIGTSIGICFYPQHGNTPEKLIDHADIALYQAKANGRGCFAYYENT